MDFQRSVRTKQYKLIVYPKISQIQLFDLEKDPWEIHDRVDDPALVVVRNELVGRLKQFQKKMGDPLDLKVA